MAGEAHLGRPVAAPHVLCWMCARAQMPLMRDALQRMLADALPAVVFVRTGGDDAAEGGGGGGGFRVLASDALGAKAGERIRNAKAFVDEQMKASAEALSPTPRFPPRRRPRKVADVKYAALSEENADAECFGKNKRVPGTCVVAFLPAGSREAHDAVMEATAKKYRNDPFAFFWADAAEQAEMMKASFGLDAATKVTFHGERHGGRVPPWRPWKP